MNLEIVLGFIFLERWIIENDKVVRVVKSLMFGCRIIVKELRIFSLENRIFKENVLVVFIYLKDFYVEKRFDFIGF